MNLIERLHGQANGHPAESHGHNIPFWVRHYDQVTNLITGGRTKTIHQETLALAGLQTGEAVLDIGCGTGLLSLEAEKIVGSAGKVVGLDVEPAMIKQARHRAAGNHSGAIFDTASIEQIPLADNTFDVAISSLMFHHLSAAQKEAGVGELLRVLKPNGRLLVVDLNPSHRSILTRLPGHNRLEQQDYVRAEVTRQMQAAGFANITSGAHPFQKLSYAKGQKRGHEFPSAGA